MASAAEEDPVQHGEKGLNDGKDRNRNAGGDKSGLDRVRTLREVYDGTAHGFASRQRRIFSPVTSAKLTANRFDLVKSPVRKNTKCLPVKAGESNRRFSSRTTAGIAFAVPGQDAEQSPKPA